MENPHEHQLHTLFAALTAGDLATFLERCTDDMSLTVRGTSARTTIVPKREIVNWHESMEVLAGRTLCSSVSLVLVDGDENVVMIRYAFEREGLVRSYETANHCAFRADRLAAWFSYPLSQTDYAEAWGIGALPEYQPA
jgi:ketosteroid isomerase-like protein